MIDVIVDTSVWIDMVRRVESAEVSALCELEARHARIGITDVVYAELLSGTVDASTARRLHTFRDTGSVARIGSLDDFERAAECFRATAGIGRRVRSISDCLIASVCIRDGIPILARDSDFQVLASCTDLQVLPV